MKFGHVAIRVKDIDKMLAFYCGKLGFTEAFRLNNDDGSLRLIYVHISDGQYLELCTGGEIKRDFDDKKTLGVRHICFTVEDLDAKSREFGLDIITLRDNNKAIYVSDPEGNKIEIMQMEASSPQKKFESKMKFKND